jgi:hypothetical protein
MKYIAKLSIVAFAVAFAFILVIGVAAPALSTPNENCQDYHANIMASFLTSTGLSGSDNAIFGAKLGATSFFDAWCDLPEAPAPPGRPNIRAYFYGDPLDPSGIAELHASYIAPGSMLTWPLAIEQNNPNTAGYTATITLTWDLSNIPTTCSVQLRD